LSRKKTKVKVLPTILTAIAVFVGVLAASIILQLLFSPDFKGFGRDSGSSDDPQKYQVFIIGDSLTYGASKEIEKAIKNTTIEAEVGRNMAEGVEILRDKIDTGGLSKDAIIVVCLAHNITGTTLQDAQTIVDMIEPGQSLVMMTGHGRESMEPVNELIRSFPNIYPFVTVADWDSTIAQSPSLLADDGVHISGNRGNALYADLILRAIEATQPKP